MKVGTILNFHGTWMSGLAYLTVMDDDGIIDEVMVDNAPCVRALAAAFGEEVIGPNHTVNTEALRGKRITYTTDFMGILEGFTPLEEGEVGGD